MNFNQYASLAETLENEIGDKPIVGLVEPIIIEGIGRVDALIDSGNGAYNVLHGTNIQINGNEVSFRTINDRLIVKDITETVNIHVGSGHKEDRPVVEFTIEMENKVYPDVKFSIADRSQNDHLALISADFISQINAMIDVNKDKNDLF